MKEIIPFGKYKDQPIEILAQDKNYTNWLLSTDWFKDKYSNIYNIVINNFQKPTDSPEHNKIQIKFLDKDYRLKFAYAVLGGELFHYNNQTLTKLFQNIFSELKDHYTSAYYRKIDSIKRNIAYSEEQIKRDIAYCEEKVRLYPNTPLAEVTKIQHIMDVSKKHLIKIKERKELEELPDKDAYVEGEVTTLLQPFIGELYPTIEFSEVDFENSHTSTDVKFSISVGCLDSYDLTSEIREKTGVTKNLSAIFNFSIEIKPIVYDDFPTILRQMKHSNAQYLLTREYRGQGATKEEFINYFKTQGIMVLFEETVIDTVVPNYPNIFKFQHQNIPENQHRIEVETHWNVEQEGRRWDEIEQKIRMEKIPKRLSIENGKIFSSDVERINMLKMLFENLGKKKILEILKEIV